MYFLEMGHSRPIFFMFAFYISQLVENLVHKTLQMTGFERGSLVSEATALPTEPQPLPCLSLFLLVHLRDQTHQISGLMHLKKDVAPADELAFEKDLRVSRPFWEVLDADSEVVVRQDVVGLELDIVHPQDLTDGVGEAAPKEEIPRL